MTKRTTKYDLVTCKDCNKEFLKSRYTMKQWSGRCRSCAGIFRTPTNRAPRYCIACAGVIDKPKNVNWSVYQRRLFCGDPCQRSFMLKENNPQWRQRIPVLCTKCDKEIPFPEMMPPSTRLKKRFCGRICQSEFHGYRKVGETYPRGGSDYTKVKSENGRARGQHRVIAETALGRTLKKSEVVHHINGVRSDNRNTNLLICSNSYHRQLHEEMGRRYMQEHFGA